MIKLLKAEGKKAKRVGRGMGSGKGSHTVGRGQKGQKSRGKRKIGILFEGIKVKKSLIKKLPLQRGKDKFKSHAKPITVKMGKLNILPAGSVVDLEMLIKHGIVEKESGQILGVKILGDGTVEKKFIVKLPISKQAAKAIEKAGGSVENAK
jgi:large subunit ribosomal protein L15